MTDKQVKQMNTNTQTADLITIAALLSMLRRRSRQYVYDLMKRDDTFPKPVRTPGGQIVWRLREVVEWIEALPRAEFVGLDAFTRREREKSEERMKDGTR